MKKRKLINGKILIWLLITVLLTTASFADAQQSAKIPRIGYLSGAGLDSRREAFRQGLRELGYVEGKNIVIEYRSAEGKPDRLPELAAELVQLKIDIIVSGPGVGVEAAMKASKTIPIVFASVGDPVGSGYVASLARPGGNVTGLTQVAPDLQGKRLELLKEAIPKANLVALLWNPSTRGKSPITEVEPAAKALGLKLQSLEVRGVEDFDKAFQAAKRKGAHALFVTPNPVINNQLVRISSVRQILSVLV